VKKALSKPKTTTVETIERRKFSPELFKKWSKNIRVELTEWIKWLGWIFFFLDSL